MSDHQSLPNITEQIGQIVTHVTNNPEYKKQLVQEISGQLFQSLGSVLIKAGQLTKPFININEALTPARKLSDGTALFLFNNYKQHIGINLLLVSLHSLATTSMFCMSLNEEETTKSVITLPTEEYKVEIQRQLYAAGYSDGDYLFGVAHLTDIPAEYEFHMGPDPVINSVANTVSDVEPLSIQLPENEIPKDTFAPPPTYID